jgi:cell division protein FtsB
MTKEAETALREALAAMRAANDALTAERDEALREVERLKNNPPQQWEINTRGATI